MNVAEYAIDACNVGRRTETVVRAWLPDVPRSRLLKWLRCGTIRINGKRARPDQRLEQGDILRAPRAALRADTLRPARNHGAPLLPSPEVVYEDGDLIVLNKPAGLAAHPGMMHDDDSLSARLVQYLGAENAAPGQKPGLAQRLDIGVSGLLPCGKHAAALKVLMGPPHGPVLEKTYLAIVDGVPEEDEGHIRFALRVTDAPLGNVPKVVVDEVDGKPAHTEYRVLARWSSRALLALRIHTGRTHQIRAHLLAIGHPLLGDPRYNTVVRNMRAHESYGVVRPMLHAAHLRMRQPMQQEQELSFYQPMPKDMLRVAGNREVPAWESQVASQEWGQTPS